MNLNTGLITDFKEKLFKKKDFLIIESGNFNLKAAHFCFPDGKIKLQNLWIEKVAGLSRQEKETKLLSFLRNNFTPQNLKNIKTFFIFPEKSFVVRRITIPFISLQEIPSILKFKLQDEIPLNIEKAVYVWKIIGERVNSEGIKQLDLIISAILKEKIDEVAKLCKAAGLLLYGVYSSLFLLAEYFNLLNTDKQVGILDLGGVSASFMIFRKNTPLFLRNISFSSNQLTETIVSAFKDYDISFDEAENIKKKYGLSGKEKHIHKGVTARDLVSCLRFSIEKLVLEVKRSIEYYNLEFDEDPIEKIYLLGAGSQLKGLDSFLSKKLNAEVIIFPFLEDIKTAKKFRKESFSIYIPVLLSAVSAKDNNFLPKELRASELEKIGSIILKAGVPFLLFVYFFLFMNLNFQIKDYQKRLQYAQMHLGTLEETKKIKKEIAEKEKILNEFKKFYIPGDWIMKNISIFLPMEIILRKVDLDARQGFVYLEGYLPDIGDAQEILAEYSANLRKIGIFKNVNIANIAKGREGTGKITAFKINCKLISFR